jgi:hypothetical protein
LEEVAASCVAGGQFFLKGTDVLQRHQPVEAFLKHMAAERWPSHALAARENCTVWCTVGELRDSLVTIQLALN